MWAVVFGCVEPECYYRSVGRVRFDVFARGIAPSCIQWVCMALDLDSLSFPVSILKTVGKLKNGLDLDSHRKGG